jgi:NADH-quinone oxidoreductase subunit E
LETSEVFSFGGLANARAAFFHAFFILKAHLFMRFSSLPWYISGCELKAVGQISTCPTKRVKEEGMDATGFSVSDIEDILNHHPYGSDISLIAVMEELQARYRYLPQDALILVSERLGVPLSQVYSVATFYNVFSLVPKGEHLVSVCLGTACHVKGGDKILDKIRRELSLDSRETTEDHRFTVEEVRCLGCCSLSPVVRVDNDTYAHLTQERVPKVLKKYQPATGE